MLRLVAAPNGKNLNCCLDDAPLRLPPDARSTIKLISVHDISLAAPSRFHQLPGSISVSCRSLSSY